MQRPKGEKEYGGFVEFKEGGEECRGHTANSCVKNPKTSGEISKRVLRGRGQGHSAF